ncbi:proteasome subunit beta [Mobilicoccus pelagius]|uniref:Proteasome subunit beta n=1 Tax=Mobilicoccus pelagius NBRC 104925 TaxID=1089455 RepID=H5UTG0_9MICO|nr:proteasome subunit beta [Mobilicoccus pelagius]GAB49018.1 20S proteasome beta subunit [Mobilicoccus pelagius NBRC 104925]
MTALPPEFRAPGSSSFTEFLGAHAPDLLPGNRVLPTAAGAELTPHGTTIVAVTFGDPAGGAGGGRHVSEGYAPQGVVLAGDRRATLGNLIASRDIRKVFLTDAHTAVGIAGTAGIATELVRLFAVELEHYEKVEGAPLSLDGKANRLATLLRSNLGLALQGLAVVPLFVGYDTRAHVARVFGYDVAGGCYEEHDHHGVGSGALFARGALKKLWRRGLDEPAAVRVVVEALHDAADDDAATGGPDVGRRIWPTVAVVDAGGARLLSDAEVGDVVAALVEDRRDNPGGVR